MSRKGIFSLFCLILSISLGTVALAQVSGNSGSFSTSVPIAVPSFHGLEPGIALAYNSSGGNSTVGVGWSLTGFSYVQRQGTDGGTPQYDSGVALLEPRESPIFSVI